MQCLEQIDLWLYCWTDSRQPFSGIFLLWFVYVYCLVAEPRDVTHTSYSMYITTILYYSHNPINHLEVRYTQSPWDHISFSMYMTTILYYCHNPIKHLEVFIDIRYYRVATYQFLRPLAPFWIREREVDELESVYLSLVSSTPSRNLIYCPRVHWIVTDQNYMWLSIQQR